MNNALKALDKGIKYFHSISTNGGYVYTYTLDLKGRWGEGTMGRGKDGQASPTQIWIQPPGTPTVGEAFLRAFKITGEKYYLSAAEDVGDALIEGQKKPGGWDRQIDFSVGAEDGPCMFDDDNTQSAIRFLMALDQVIQKRYLKNAVEKGLGFMLESQFENGGWPQWYPLRGSYHDFYTYNDGAINDCIKVMMDAHKYYGKEEYLESIRKAGWFMILSQLPPPQPGWAQQYNLYLQPAWARAFEPPAVCPAVTRMVINSLIEIYLYTGSRRYLEPIPDALRWLKETKRPEGYWPRFIELGTGRALYYDYGRIWCATINDLSVGRRTGYSYHSRIDLERLIENYNEVNELSREKYLEKKNKPLSSVEKLKKLESLETAVGKIISSQDKIGRWIVSGRSRSRIPGRRWDGEYKAVDRIRTGTVVRNINTLLDYIELKKSL